MLRPNSKKQLIVLVEYLSSADLSFFFFFHKRNGLRMVTHSREELSVNQHTTGCLLFGGGITIEANNISCRHLMDANRVLTWNFSSSSLHGVSCPFLFCLDWILIFFSFFNVLKCFFFSFYFVYNRFFFLFFFALWFVCALGDCSEAEGKQNEPEKWLRKRNRRRRRKW